MVETVDPLDRATQRDIAGEKDVWPVQRDEQETVRRPRSDARPGTGDADPDQERDRGAGNRQQSGARREAGGQTCREKEKVAVTPLAKMSRDP